MRLSALLASLTLLALLFAGCSGGDGDGTTSTSSSSSATATATSSSTSRSSTGTTTSSTSTTTGAKANAAPSGTISAVSNGTLATFTLNGTDADGDSLTWALDFGDGSANATGTDLPANVTHTYAAGNYTANFTVTDGKDSATSSVALVAAAGAGVGQTVTAPWTAGGQWCAVYGSSGTSTPTQGGGVLWASFPIEATTFGKPFTATITTTAGQALFGALSFLDAAGSETANFQPLFFMGSPTFTGEVPADSVVANFFTCGGVAGSLAYTA